MIPLTVNPTVVVRLSDPGAVVQVASNVAPDLKVVVVYDEATFEYEAANKPFVDDSAGNVILGGKSTVSLK